MFRSFFSFLSKPRNLAIANAILIVAAVCTNILFQAFCRPTLWAGLVLALCFLNTIFYPLLREGTVLFYVSGFVSGVSLGVFAYCVIFLEHINFLGFFLIILMGLGLGRLSRIFLLCN